MDFSFCFSRHTLPFGRFKCKVFKSHFSVRINRKMLSENFQFCTFGKIFSVNWLEILRKRNSLRLHHNEYKSVQIHKRQTKQQKIKWQKMNHFKVVWIDVVYSMQLFYTHRRQIWWKWISFNMHIKHTSKQYWNEFDLYRCRDDRQIEKTEI